MSGYFEWDHQKKLEANLAIAAQAFNESLWAIKEQLQDLNKQLGVSNDPTVVTSPSPVASLQRIAEVLTKYADLPDFVEPLMTGLTERLSSEVVERIRQDNAEIHAENLALKKRLEELEQKSD